MLPLSRSNRWTIASVNMQTRNTRNVDLYVIQKLGLEFRHNSGGGGRFGLVAMVMWWKMFVYWHSEFVLAATLGPLHRGILRC
jgi:hypothetical protein